MWSSLPTNHGFLCFLLHPIPKGNTSGLSRPHHACPSPSQCPLSPSSSISLHSFLLIWKPSARRRVAVQPAPHTLYVSHHSSFSASREGWWARDTCTLPDFQQPLSQSRSMQSTTFFPSKCMFETDSSLWPEGYPWTCLSRYSKATDELCVHSQPSVSLFFPHSHIQRHWCLIAAYLPDSLL